LANRESPAPRKWLPGFDRSRTEEILMRASEQLLMVRHDDLR
jgi:hypothetical protein